MSDMIAFCTSILGLLADFLATEPIFYLFALICFVFVCKAVKIFLP